MTDPRPIAACVFGDRRQAIGWLAARWAGSLMVLLVWAGLLGIRPADAALATWWSAASAILVLGLAGFNVWGHGASSEPGRRLRDEARRRELPWWQRDRFVQERAADRLGWTSGPVVWITRTLLALAAVVTVTAVPLVVLRWM